MDGDISMKVCVLGLGRVGLPTAEYVASKGFTVYGYDISEKAVKIIRKCPI